MLRRVTFPLLLLPEADRAAVISRLKMQKFDAGQVVYERRVVCRDVFFIFEGKIRSEAQDLHGDMAFFQLRGPGEIIGFYSAITDEPQPVTTAAVSFLAIIKGGVHLGAHLYVCQRERKRWLM